MSEWDLLLELCSTYGEGSVAQFQNLVKKSLGDRELHSEALQQLAALGYVDVEYDSYAARQYRWAIAPPVIGYLKGGAAFVTGMRGQAVSKSIEYFVGELDGRVEWITEAGSRGPTSVFIRGLDLDGLVLVAGAVTSETGSHVSVQDRPDLIIASTLLPLSSMMKTNELNRPAGRIARWSMGGSAPWEPDQAASEEGLYQAGMYPVQYWLMKGGLWRRTNSRVGKHLAAWWNQRRLLSYEGTNLYCPLGAQLPGLYERAVTLASGLPPKKEGGRVVYRNVPAEVAALVSSAVFPEV
jgi:hypothetical protein